MQNMAKERGPKPTNPPPPPPPRVPASNPTITKSDDPKPLKGSPTR